MIIYEPFIFDNFKIPKVPFQLPVSNIITDWRKCVKESWIFLKHSSVQVYGTFASVQRVPVEDMAEDVVFAKKYMLGLALVLKKGLILLSMMWNAP